MAAPQNFDVQNRGPLRSPLTVHTTVECTLNRHVWFFVLISVRNQFFPHLNILNQVHDIILVVTAIPRLFIARKYTGAYCVCTHSHFCWFMQRARYTYIRVLYGLPYLQHYCSR